MTDKDFIDKLNDIIFNYGYIIIDMDNNCEYYLDRYNIKNHFKVYKTYIDAGHFHGFQLFNIKENRILIGFSSVDTMIDDPWSIFKYVKRDYDRVIKIFTVDFVNFIMSIEGTSKEEIILKMQMMGY